MNGFATAYELTRIIIRNKPNHTTGDDYLTDDINVKMIERRIEGTLDILRESYNVEEIDTKGFAEMNINGMAFRIRQFDVKKVGNLVMMTMMSGGPMQMDTITLTPYFKNLPLFSSDYVYKSDGRIIINEIYDLVPYKDSLYDGYIEKFKFNMAECGHLADMKAGPNWYDDIRSAHLYKAATAADDELLISTFQKNLDTFIEMEKASPLLKDDLRNKKLECNREYVRKLIAAGGPSTQMFVAAFGPERTGEFYNSVFFAPDRY